MTASTITSGAHSAIGIFQPRHGTMRGMPVFAPDGDEGTAAEATAEPGKSMSPEAHKLLKELMSLKADIRASKKATSERLAAFEAAGINPDTYHADLAALKTSMAASAAAVAAADQDKAITAENWNGIRANLIAANKAELQTVHDQLAASGNALKERNSIIADLTLGAAFAGSKFIADETVFTGSKARKLFEDRFSTENGKVIAYDAPHGTEGRSPMVDGAGEPVSFDTAMRAIIDADPERTSIMRASRLKSGTAQKPVPVHVGAGIDRIAVALHERHGTQSQSEDGAAPVSLNHRDTHKPHGVNTVAKRDVGPSRISDALKAGSLPRSSQGGPVRSATP
ncbi:hypothetical protein HN018_13185 [Lichenicola cladoniae]|uniref:DUF6651 domain-containing protein n=1 Tax=Lichenicola cladoniae TaxID=1484109 RepID=A0A6M8HRF8_9PROT|nr:DUF6651 domain-containing protein [Lichenicola cladoniae]NPD69033.1 hypothetical protein [Acetobacteraceae bacterium]QKE90865.1 hypothetical protein HN018_13185 [Lichenicola cladoniae]